jgi:hypothetical protein
MNWLPKRNPLHSDSPFLRASRGTHRSTTIFLVWQNPFVSILQK